MVTIAGIVMSCAAEPPATSFVGSVGAVVPRLSDPVLPYRQLGFIAGTDGVPFVASVGFLAGESPDSTLAVFAASLSNSALSFRQRPNDFEARYSVQVTFHGDGGVLGRFDERETVRVETFAETRREDESIIFQRFLNLPPGAAVVVAVVRDENNGQESLTQDPIYVPTLGSRPALAVVAVHQARPRRAIGEHPQLVTNPRATAEYARDTLMFYLESGPSAAASEVQLEIATIQGERLWRDSTVLRRTGSLATAIARVDPEALPAGSYRLEVTWGGAPDTVRTPVVVVLPGLPVVGGLSEVLSLLRYYDDPGLEAVRRSGGVQQAMEWRRFWASSDPDRRTPRHEALTVYFRRLMEADARFVEAGQPGWLTDRGKVFITLGPPNHMDEQRSLDAAPGRIRWTYRGADAEEIELEFAAVQGTGRFRLTARSRADYQRVLRFRKDPLDRTADTAPK